MGFMRKWHRYLGLWTTVLVLLVSITGVLLIHKKELGLNRVMVNLPGYAKSLPPDAFDMISTGAGQTLLSTKVGVFTGSAGGWRCTLPIAAKKFYLDGTNVYVCTVEGLQLSVDNGESWRNVLPGGEAKALHLKDGEGVAATGKGIYGRTSQGKWELIAQLPGKGIDVRELVPQGEGYLLAAKEGLYRLTNGKVKKVKLAGGEQAATGVELQKLITDLHTGTFFGTWAYLLVDAAAFGLVYLAVSGIYLWYVPRKKKRSLALPG